ncbi:hypothetical protein FIV42_18890 [Persicimonas caeni]|uniref:Uncharacterized protein n=1 Tax=Persicimonas caeni TaxID=2292766 RepID=A0A4Y6PWM0_PERCE|nr:hypothetical protein [Persicimonas caeni]QDG52731.1 hypothetical protein FIV42_18890 [Persicimonas caeni]QED33953.1 hypothetical protein FRD00_18885 [Persicimonas caeni]
MKKRYPLNILTALLVCVMSTQIAWGQGAGNASAGDDPLSELTSEDSLSLLDEDIDSLSNQEMLSRASKKVKTMRQTLARTGELLDTVQEKERDVLKVNCINEKQAAMKGFVKVSEQAYVNLETAAQKGDNAEAKHNYKLVSLGNQRVKSLSQEARLCTGEERRFAGKGDIEVVRPDNGKEEVDGPDEGDILTEDLPELTPYQ